MSYKLLDTLDILDNKEWSSYRKFLLSKTGRQSDNFKFFEFLQKRRLRLNHLGDAETIRLEHFPKFSQKSFLNMMSRLTGWLEEWIVIESLESNPLEKHLRLNRFYNTNGLYKYADQQARNLEQKARISKGLDLESLTIHQQLLHQQYYSNNPIKKTADRDLLLDLLSLQFNQSLYSYTVYMAELFNRSALRDCDYSSEIALCRQLISTLNAGQKPDLVHLIRLVEDNDTRALYTLKEMLFSNEINRKSELHTVIAMYAIAYSLKFWMQSVLTDRQLISDLYHYGLKHKVLMNNGSIPMVRFHNMISTLGTIQDYKWCQAFIQKWYKSVHSSDPGSTLALANAQNAFYHHRYELILEELRGLEFQNIIQKTRALGLELIGTYTDRQIDVSLLLSRIHNFQRYLRRNKSKMSKAYFESHYNLSRFIDKLHKANYNQKIKLSIDEFSPLIYKSWASEQLN